MIKLSELDPILCTQESLHYTSMQTLLYYVLHGISALEVVVLYLSRYQHHDENLAGKLSQSWSEKSSGSTRKRMDDAFKSLWSVALELELILALILMQFFSVQQHKRKRSSVAKLKEKKGFLVEEQTLLLLLVSPKELICHTSSH